jgi:TonB family protein
MRRIDRGIATALLGLAALACANDQPAPASPTDEIQGIQIATDAYLAYQHSDCETVYQLTQPSQIDALQATELRHSLRLVRGFCQELDGDQPAARATYGQLIDEAPGSFAAADARERLETLDRLADDPDFARRVEAASKRAPRPSGTREPSSVREPALYPPLARAAGVEGFAVIEFGVTRRGETVDPIVVDSDPPFVFEASSLRAVRGWQYKSQRRADPDERQLIRIVFRTALDPVTLEDPEAAPAAP